MYGLPSIAAFEALPLEARIRLAVSDLLGWGYGGPFVPERPSWWPREVRVATGEREELIDCSTLGTLTLSRVYPSARWTLEAYADLQTFKGRPAWSSIEAVERLGIGREVASPVPHRWHVGQWWRDPVAMTGGHFRIFFAGPDGLLVLESTTLDSDGDGVRDGVRWIAAGPIAGIPGSCRLAVLRG